MGWTTDESCASGDESARYYERTFGRVAGRCENKNTKKTLFSPEFSIPTGPMGTGRVEGISKSMVRAAAGHFTVADLWKKQIKEHMDETEKKRAKRKVMLDEMDSSDDALKSNTIKISRNAIGNVRIENVDPNSSDAKKDSSDTAALTSEERRPPPDAPRRGYWNCGPLWTQSIWEEKVEKRCCAKNCTSQFTVDHINKLRMPWSGSGSLTAFERNKEWIRLWESGEGLEVKNKKGEDSKCCVKFFSWLCNCSTRTIYNDLKLGSNRLCPKQKSILAWFMELEEILDIMPGEGFYQIAAPSRKEVYRWYSNDVAAMLQSKNAIWQCQDFLPVSESYFNQVWRNECFQFRLRKCLMFSKCTTCGDLRKQCHDRNRDKITRYFHL